MWRSEVAKYKVFFYFSKVMMKACLRTCSRRHETRSSDVGISVQKRRENLWRGFHCSSLVDWNEKLAIETAFFGTIPLLKSRLYSGKLLQTRIAERGSRHSLNSLRLFQSKRQKTRYCSWKSRGTEKTANTTEKERIRHVGKGSLNLKLSFL